MGFRKLRSSWILRPLYYLYVTKLTKLSRINTLIDCLPCIIATSGIVRNLSLLLDHRILHQSIFFLRVTVETNLILYIYSSSSNNLTKFTNKFLRFFFLYFLRSCKVPKFNSGYDVIDHLIYVYENVSLYDTMSVQKTKSSKNNNRKQSINTLFIQ